MVFWNNPLRQLILKIMKTIFFCGYKNF